MPVKARENVLHNIRRTIATRGLKHEFGHRIPSGFGLVPGDCVLAFNLDQYGWVALKLEGREFTAYTNLGTKEEARAFLNAQTVGLLDSYVSQRGVKELIGQGSAGPVYVYGARYDVTVGADRGTTATSWYVVELYRDDANKAAVVAYEDDEASARRIARYRVYAQPAEKS